METTDLQGSKAVAAAPGIDPGIPQGFIGVDVAEARNFRLIHQHDLDGPA